MSLSFLHGVPLAFGSELIRLRYTAEEEEEEAEDSGSRLALELEGVELATATILIEFDALETRFLRDCREGGIIKPGLKIPQLWEKEKMSLLLASAGAEAEEEGVMVVEAMVGLSERSRAAFCPLLLCQNIFERKNEAKEKIFYWV